MNWKSIKNFMIILLVAVNVFLAFMLIRQTSMKLYNDQSLSDIKEILLSSGIIADDEFLTLKTKVLNVYGCNIDKNYASQTADMLMKDGYADTFVTPEGITFFSKNGDLLKVGNGFEIYYSAVSFSLPEQDGSAIREEEMQSLNEMLGSLLLSNSLDNEKYGFIIERTSKTGDILIAHVKQTVDKIPVGNHYLECIFKEDQLLYLNGRWCFLPINENSSAHLLDSVNILFNEKNELDAQKVQNNEDSSASKDAEPSRNTIKVKSMDQCYCSHLSNDGSKLYFIPSWHIEWEEDNIEDTYYNAINGEKSPFHN